MSYYERWQKEKYGNILPASNHEEELENGSKELEDLEIKLKGEVLIDFMEFENNASIYDSL
jgi:hypothetical protein